VLSSSIICSNVHECSVACILQEYVTNLICVKLCFVFKPCSYRDGVFHDIGFLAIIK